MTGNGLVKFKQSGSNGHGEHCSYQKVIINRSQLEQIPKVIGLRDHVKVDRNAPWEIRELSSGIGMNLEAATETDVTFRIFGCHGAKPEKTVKQTEELVTLLAKSAERIFSGQEARVEDIVKIRAIMRK